MVTPPGPGTVMGTELGINECLLRSGLQGGVSEVSIFSFFLLIPWIQSGRKRSEKKSTIMPTYIMESKVSLIGKSREHTHIEWPAAALVLGDAQGFPGVGYPGSPLGFC